MRVLRHLVGLFLLFGVLAAGTSAATLGSFRGTVVESDESPLDSAWLYVRGRDGGIRKVDISHAIIAYDEGASNNGRTSAQRSDLVAGTDVRVTAEQGSDGEWRAKSVEIVKKAEGAKTPGKVGKS